jgi:hypothetical protein
LLAALAAGQGAVGSGLGFVPLIFGFGFGLGFGLGLRPVLLIGLRDGGEVLAELPVGHEGAGGTLEHSGEGFLVAVEELEGWVS